MRRPLIAALALTSSLLACGTEPSAALRLPCDAQARFVGPIVLDAAGGFEAAGPVVQRYTAAQVHVTGLLQGSELRLTLRFTYEGGGSETKTAVLRRDVQPDFSQAVCFA